VGVVGLTKVQAKIYGPKGTKEISLIVDTGAEDTWIAAKSLDELGVEPRFTRTYRTINNARIQRAVAPLEIELLGTRMPCPTVFAEEQDVNVLGATALEIRLRG
jgi:predicted aspartyl protease